MSVNCSINQYYYYIDGEIVKCIRSLNCTYKLPVHSKTRLMQQMSRSFTILLYVLCDTWWTHRKWKTCNADQILLFWCIWLFARISNGHNTRSFVSPCNVGNLTDLSCQKLTIITIILNKYWSKTFHFEKWFSRINNYIMWSYNWKSLYHWRKPLSLGGHSVVLFLTGCPPMARTKSLKLIFPL